MRQIPTRAVPLLIAIGFSLLLLIVVLMPKHAPISPLVSKPVPAFYLPRLDNAHKYFMPHDFAGRPALLNVFASWCQPCKEEMPLLMNLAKEGKVAIYGIAWRDKPDTAAAMLREQGNPFQIIGMDSVPVTTVPLGLLGVPTTYLIDAHGVVRAKWDAPLTETIIQKELEPLLAQMGAVGAK